MKIVVYDGAGLFSAPRVWWTFRAFGARDVAILEGGFPAWTAAGLPVEDGRLRDPDAIRAALDKAGIDPSRPIIATCGSGVTASILALALDQIGQPARALYDGAWAEWGSREDLPAATGSAEKR